MSSKRNKISAILANFNPSRYEVDERRLIPTKNSKTKVFLIKSVSKSNCKRFRNTTIRENFKPKPDAQMKKLILIKDATRFTNTMK